MKLVVDRAFFMDLTLRSGFTANSHLAEVMWVKFAAWPRVCAVLCETSTQVVNLSVQTEATNTVY
jgi:hypothetical protein